MCRKVTAATIISLLLLCAVTACGGGGGGNTANTSTDGNKPSKEGIIFSVSMGNTAGGATHSELENAFQALQELGGTHTKWNVNWAMTEPSKGVFDWSQLDDVASLATRYGISIIIFCNQSSIPPWALKSGTQFAPDNPADYANFVYEVVARYKQSMAIRYVEIFNELATGSDDGITPPFTGLWDDSIAYSIEVGNTIYDKIHSNFDDVQVGIVSFSQIHAIGSSMSAEESQRSAYLQTYLSSNPQPEMDFLALHDYPHYGPTQTGPYQHASQYDFLSLYRSYLDSNGYLDTPLFITEGSVGGFDNSTEELGVLMSQNMIALFSKRDQFKLMGMVKGILANVYGATEYNLIDIATGNKYQAYDDLKNVRSKLTEYPEFLGLIEGTADTEGSWIFKFGNSSGGTLYVAFAPILISYADEEHPDWNNGKILSYSEPQLATINTDKIDSKVTITQLDGSTTVGWTDGNGCLSLAITTRPVFVEFPVL